MTARLSLGLAALCGWLLLARATSEAACSSSAGAADQIALVQSSTRRHQPMPVGLINGSMTDVDGCPVSDPGLAFSGWNATDSEDGDDDCGLNSGRRGEPKASDREVYFLRHARPRCGCDCGLEEEGVRQCEGLRANNRLLRLGPLDPSRRPQVVYVSPSTRTLETAVRIFGDVPTPFVIEPRLSEDFGKFNPCRTCAMEILGNLSRPDLVRQYDRVIPGDDLGKVPGLKDKVRQRLNDFTAMLLKGKARRIVVVSHFFAMNKLMKGMGCMEMGNQVVKAALTEEGSWDLRSESTCSGRRRRWKFGNAESMRNCRGRDGDTD